MARDDWFRNTSWNARIADAFDAKLRRARRRGQYLRIQACTLAESHPEAALALLDRYFDQPDERFDDAQAHVDRATALLALERVDDAIGANESALAQEAKRPNLLTMACIELPYLIAMRALERHYARAFDLLIEHRERLMFPVDHFRWHVDRALMLRSSDPATARESARKALEFATKTIRVSDTTRSSAWSPNGTRKRCDACANSAIADFGSRRDKRSAPRRCRGKRNWRARRDSNSRPPGS